MDPILVKNLSDALTRYKQAVLLLDDRETKEDCSRLAVIADKIIAALQVGDMAKVKLGVLGFSRQVSDSFTMQPPEFKQLAEKVAGVKKLVI